MKYNMYLLTDYNLIPFVTYNRSNFNICICTLIRFYIIFTLSQLKYFSIQSLMKLQDTYTYSITNPNRFEQIDAQFSHVFVQYEKHGYGKKSMSLMLNCQDERDG